MSDPIPTPVVQTFPLCECGCGKPVLSKGKRFLRGHAGAFAVKARYLNGPNNKQNLAPVNVISIEQAEELEQKQADIILRAEQKKVGKALKKVEEVVGEQTAGDILKKIGEEVIDPIMRKNLYNDGVRNLGKDATKLEAMYRNVFNHAIKGKQWAVQEILNRMEGQSPLNLKLDINDRKLTDEELDAEVKRLETVIITTAVEKKPEHINESAQE